MGHSIQLDGNYYRLSHDEMLQEYLKAVDLLAINEENNLRRQPESKKAKWKWDNRTKGETGKVRITNPYPL